MRILKNGQEQTWLGIQSVDGALYSVNEDEPVFLTIRTNQSINYVASNLASFTLEHLGIQQTLQLADVEIVGKINLASGGYLYTYRLLCKKSSTDFTPKTWYKQQYTVLNTRYGHLSGQLQVAEYQVTNLLGSYGSFSVDSNGDGLADGWTVGNTTGSATTYSLNNGQRRILSSKWLNNTGSVKVMNLSFGIDLQTNTNKFFYRNIISITVTDTISSNVAGFYTLKVDLGGGTVQYNAISKIMYFTQTGTYLYNDYGTCSNNGTNNRAIIYTLQFNAVNNETIPAHDSTVSKVIFVDLTTMGELPQPLKQFFAPSNITKWEDFAVFGNTNVMCILKDANGNYIAKKGNDWLNDLIPYVENTANIRLPVYI